MLPQNKQTNERTTKNKKHCMTHHAWYDVNHHAVHHYVVFRCTIMPCVVSPQTILCLGDSLTRFHWLIKEKRGNTCSLVNHYFTSSTNNTPGTSSATPWSMYLLTTWKVNKLEILNNTIQFQTEGTIHTIHFYYFVFCTHLIYLFS